MKLPKLLTLCGLIAVAALLCTSQAEAGHRDASCGCEAPVACAPTCCYNPCIKYRHVMKWKKACCGCGQSEMVLTVQDPTKCGCALDVPVCVPCCCTGEPCVKSRCGLLGRGVVTYEWCCGYKLTVTFKKCGDVTVTYFGS